MAANALRFGNLPHNPHHLSIADSWAMDAGDKLLSTVFNEFGAIELMVGTCIYRADKDPSIMPSLRLSGRSVLAWMAHGRHGSEVRLYTEIN